MNKEEVQRKIIELIESLINENDEKINGDTHLIGGKSILDSMKLVEVCLALEDLAEENNFEFDWTSEAAMSKSRSMFRTVESLTNEFINQMET